MVTLGATNVAKAGGTISRVAFYQESNGTPGLQIGSDTLLGTGTQGRIELVLLGRYDQSGRRNADILRRRDRYLRRQQRHVIGNR